MAEDPRDAAAVDELDELLLEAKLSNDKIKSGTTIGPSARSTKLRKSTVSQFAVRNSDAESINS